MTVGAPSRRGVLCGTRLQVEGYKVGEHDFDSDSERLRGS
jgi:hypothetical protein